MKLRVSAAAMVVLTVLSAGVGHAANDGERIAINVEAGQTNALSGVIAGNGSRARQPADVHLLRKTVRSPVRGWVDVSDIFSADFGDPPVDVPPTFALQVGLIDPAQAETALAGRGWYARSSEDEDEDDDLQEEILDDLWDNSVYVQFGWEWAHARKQVPTLMVTLCDCTRVNHALNLAHDRLPIDDVRQLPTPGKVWFELEVSEEPFALPLEGWANVPRLKEVSFRGWLTLRLYGDSTYSSDALLDEQVRPYGLRSWYDVQLGNPEPRGETAARDDAAQYADYWDAPELPHGEGYGIVQFDSIGPTLTENHQVKYEVQFTRRPGEATGAGL